MSEQTYQVVWCLVGNDEKIKDTSFHYFPDQFHNRAHAEAFVIHSLAQFPTKGRNVDKDYWWGMASSFDTVQTRYWIEKRLAPTRQRPI